VVDDWFRSSAWDEQARADFEMRLARARSYNRQQYLRIKGLSLLEAGNVPAAKELFERTAAFPDGSSFETVFAWEMLGDIAVTGGDPTTAETFYRRILDESSDTGGTTGNVELSLAELLLESKPVQSDQALLLLNSWMSRGGLRFDDQLFRWYLCRIRIAEAGGDHVIVRQIANDALTLAERGPQLHYHRDLGLVRTDELTLQRLRRLAR
jgi:hypothetical protein